MRRRSSSVSASHRLTPSGTPSPGLLSCTGTPFRQGSPQCPPPPGSTIHRTARAGGRRAWRARGNGNAGAITQCRTGMAISVAAISRAGWPRRRLSTFLNETVPLAPARCRARRTATATARPAPPSLVSPPIAYEPGRSFGRLPARNTGPLLRARQTARQNQAHPSGRRRLGAAASFPARIYPARTRGSSPLKGSSRIMSSGRKARFVSSAAFIAMARESFLSGRSPLTQASGCRP